MADRFFYKFWGQSIRFVARTEDAGKKKSWIEVKPVRVQPGEEALIELRANTDTGAPVEQPSLPVEIIGPGTRTSLTLDADPNTKGRYLARYRVPVVGDFRFQYVGNAEARLRVLSAPEEMRYPNVNRSALQTLASTTGGRMGGTTDPEWHRKIIVGLKGEPKVTKRPPSGSDDLGQLDVADAAGGGVCGTDVGMRRLGGLS